MSGMNRCRLVNPLTWYYLAYGIIKTVSFAPITVSHLVIFGTPSVTLKQESDVNIRVTLLHCDHLRPHLTSKLALDLYMNAVT
jgi:hypothetical protein